MPSNKKGRIWRNFSRLSRLTIVFIFLIGTFGPSLDVSAFGEVTSRSIEMNSSAKGATNVTYYASFTTATTASLESIVINFCSNDPIIDDTCSNASGAVPTLPASPTVTVTGAGTGWTASSAFPTTPPTGCSSTGYVNSTLYLTNTTAQAVNASTAITITISGVTNPNTTNTSFYGRIFTFTNNVQTNATAADNYCPSGNNGTSGNLSALATQVDGGGVAMSTAAQITITAKVQEEILFCMYVSNVAMNAKASTATGDGGNCSGTGSSVTLGNQYGVLSSANAYTDVNTHYDIQTNASHGAVIAFTGAPLNIGNITTCGTSTANCIESSTASGTGAVATSSYGSTAGSPQFGFCTVAVAGTTANLIPQAPYDSSGNGNCGNVTQTSGTGTPTFPGDGGAYFGFNIAAAANTSTAHYYGSEFATFPNPGNFATGDIAFIGNISNTTPAGIYQTTLTFIATGTY